MCGGEDLSFLDKVIWVNILGTEIRIDMSPFFDTCEVIKKIIEGFK
jgi:hypothetical protein